MNTEFNQIIQGDAREKLKTLPAQSIQTVITSPPYYGLRDYGTSKWIGGDDECEHRRTSKTSSLAPPATLEWKITVWP